MGRLVWRRPAAGTRRYILPGGREPGSTATPIDLTDSAFHEPHRRAPRALGGRHRNTDGIPESRNPARADIDDTSYAIMSPKYPEASRDWKIRPQSTRRGVRSQPLASDPAMLQVDRAQHQQPHAGQLSAEPVPLRHP